LFLPTKSLQEARKSSHSYRFFCNSDFFKPKESRAKSLVGNKNEQSKQHRLNASESDIEEKYFKA
jgi:hypothetical protein